MWNRPRSATRNSQWNAILRPFSSTVCFCNCFLLPLKTSPVFSSGVQVSVFPQRAIQTLSFSCPVSQTGFKSQKISRSVCNGWKSDIHHHSRMWQWNFCTLTTPKPRSKINKYARLRAQTHAQANPEKPTCEFAYGLLKSYLQKGTHKVQTRLLTAALIWVIH